MSFVTNPLTGKKENRVVLKGKNVILIKVNEVHGCIEKHVTKCKGAGARKIHNRICRTFVGVTHHQIQIHLNKCKMSQRLNPLFRNKPALIPVTSEGVFDQVQMDLVTMEHSTVLKGNQTFKFVLVVLDIFSRFMFLRPLETKFSAEVAKQLVHLFNDVGPPKVVQTDQGTEFKGVVKQVMTTMGVRIIHSRPYHPQAQGKV